MTQAGVEGRFSKIRSPLFSTVFRSLTTPENRETLRNTLYTRWHVRQISCSKYLDVMLFCLPNGTGNTPDNTELIVFNKYTIGGGEEETVD